MHLPDLDPQVGGRDGGVPARDQLLQRIVDEHILRLCGGHGREGRGQCVCMAGGVHMYSYPTYLCPTMCG